MRKNKVPQIKPVTHRKLFNPKFDKRRKRTKVVWMKVHNPRPKRSKPKEIIVEPLVKSDSTQMKNQ